jgi:hypothetical protein
LSTLCQHSTRWLGAGGYTVARLAAEAHLRSGATEVAAKAVQSPYETASTALSVPTTTRVRDEV